MPAAKPRTLHTTGTCTSSSSGMRWCACSGQPPLDASGARLRGVGVRAVARHDVGAAAEVLAGAVEQDHAHAVVGRRDGERVDEPVHHHFVDRVALLGPIERDAQHRRRRARSRARRPALYAASLIAARTPPRSPRARPADRVAPPGGSGSRTAPCARLGSRIVAWPGVVELAALVHGFELELDRRPVTGRAGTCATTRPRSHCVSPT